MSDTLNAMRDKFGDDETDQYIRLAKAMRSLMRIWKGYVDAPEGSFVEALIGAEYDRMITEMKKHPEHMGGMVEGLLALIMHMRLGGSYEEWFITLGIDPEPGPDE